MILNFIIAAFAQALAAKYVAAALNLPDWTCYAFLGALGITCYLMNVALIRRYINRRAPEFESTDEVAPGVQVWELTAGIGIVPRWVSLLGLVAYSNIMAIAFLIVLAIVGH